MKEPHGTEKQVVKKWTVATAPTTDELIELK